MTLAAINNATTATEETMTRRKARTAWMSLSWRTERPFNPGNRADVTGGVTREGGTDVVRCTIVDLPIRCEDTDLLRARHLDNRASMRWDVTPCFAEMGAGVSETVALLIAEFSHRCERTTVSASPSVSDLPPCYLCASSDTRTL